MHIFNSRADFDAQMKSVKKWMRTGQALDGVADLQHDVAYSIGDSLVYWWVNAHEAATADLVGHRRYHAVLAPLDGDLTVEVAPKAGLTCTRAYSDIDDRERFEGTGETVTIPAGGVAVVEIDEAYRFGSRVYGVEVPLSKIVCFDTLLPGSLGGESEFMVLGGLYPVTPAL